MNYIIVSLVVVLVGALGFYGCAYLDDRQEGNTGWHNLALIFGLVCAAGLAALMILLGEYIGILFLCLVVYGLILTVGWWMLHLITGGRFPA